MRRCFLYLIALAAVSWSQPAPTTRVAESPPITVKVEMPPTNPWIRLVDIVVPGILAAGAALLATSIANRNNQAIQARAHQHETQLLESKLKREDAKEVNDWYLEKYTIEAIEPLEVMLTWFHETLSWGGGEDIPFDKKERIYVCLTRIATLINTYAFTRFFNMTVLCMEALLAERRNRRDLYDTLRPLHSDVLNRIVEGHRYLNQLQEALRFTIINHRSDVYTLSKHERFAAFKERAETLSDSVESVFKRLLEQIKSRDSASTKG